jgi:hypothetical protein
MKRIIFGLLIVGALVGVGVGSVVTAGSAVAGCSTKC